MQIPADCDTMKEEGRECAIEITSTKAALAAAMRDMLAETAFSRISISALCQRCGVNRKSFYYHFRDKYDLVCWIFQWEYLENATAENYLQKSPLHLGAISNGTGNISGMIFLLC